MGASHQPQTPEQGSQRLSARLYGRAERLHPDVAATGVHENEPIPATDPIVHGHLKYSHHENFTIKPQITIAPSVDKG